MWYASRSTGVVALLLLTAVALLGLLISRQGPVGGTGGRSPGRPLLGLPRFALTGLHRNISLLSVAFIALHVLTAVADGYVDIPLTSSVIPFASPYETFWLGLGAVSFDLFVAIIVTSLLRRRLSRRVWYGIHLLAYASWPVAFAHSIGASTDMRSGWLLVVAIGCALVLAVGIVWRLAAAAGDVPRADRVHALMTQLSPGRASIRVQRDAPARKPEAGAR
jgi:methionine sulfoxide reductase heme-binding subunit